MFSTGDSNHGTVALLRCSGLHEKRRQRGRRDRSAAHGGRRRGRNHRRPVQIRVFDGEYLFEGVGLLCIGDVNDSGVVGRGDRPDDDPIFWVGVVCLTSLSSHTRVAPDQGRDSIQLWYHAQYAPIAANQSRTNSAAKGIAPSAASHVVMGGPTGGERALAVTTICRAARRRRTVVSGSGESERLDARCHTHRLARYAGFASRTSKYQTGNCPYRTASAAATASPVVSMASSSRRPNCVTSPNCRAKNPSR